MINYKKNKNIEINLQKLKSLSYNLMKNIMHNKNFL